MIIDVKAMVFPFRRINLDGGIINDDTFLNGRHNVFFKAIALTQNIARQDNWRIQIGNGPCFRKCNAPFWCVRQRFPQLGKPPRAGPIRMKGGNPAG